MTPQAMEAANHKFVRALKMAQKGMIPLTSTDVSWEQEPKRNLTRKPGCKTQLLSERQQQLSMDKREAAEENRTERDPCWRCGVRADVGCKHT